MSAGKLAKFESSVAGLLVILVGIFALWEGRNYGFGSASDIGPGFFPTILSVFLIIMGLAILVFERIPTEFHSFGGADLRSLVGIVASLAVFAFVMERHGLAPAAFLSTFLAGAATPEFPIAKQALISLCITAVSVVLFVYLLKLPIDVLK